VASAVAQIISWDQENTGQATATVIAITIGDDLPECKARK
jgi:hypothetical protein